MRLEEVKKEVFIFKLKQLEANKMIQKNKVEKEPYSYEEEMKEFTGLIFHCPHCDEVFHLHIASVHSSNFKEKETKNEIQNN